MRTRRRVVTSIGAVVVVASTLVVARQVLTGPAPGSPPTRAPERAATIEAYGRLPVSFEQNVGQADPQVRYLARTGAGTLFLTGTDAMLAGPDGALRLRLDGANPAPGVEAEHRQASSTNYLRDADPARWQVGVPSFAQVRYRDVYAGVDMVWHGTRNALEYDFVVRPGADPNVITLMPEGATATRLEAGGDLVLTVGGTEVRHRRPHVYQDLGAERRAVDGAFVLEEGGRVGFVLGPYDKAAPLVIDPLVYSTFLGGTGGDDAQDIAVDSAGNAYVVGNTNAIDFPTTPGVFQPALSGIADIFVTKLNPAGSELVYSTHLGQSVSATSIEVDDSGNAYVVGSTSNTSFPTTPGAFQAANAGGQKVVVAKLNPTGTGLLYSTYLGGSAGDSPADMDLDAAGSVYVTGSTYSSDFPTTAGAFDTTWAGNRDGFVTKLNATGSALSYSTYIGGSHSDEFRGIAADSSGSAYVAGSSLGSDFPTTPGAYQTTRPNPVDFQAPVVAKLNPAGSALDYATYVGSTGSQNSVATSIDSDSSGHAYIAGATGAPDFPTTAVAFQTTKPNLPSGNHTGFITKLNPVGSGLVYSTYLGGTNGGDIPAEIVVDTAGSAYVAGSANATTFPLVDPVQPAFGGAFYDAYVSVLSPSGSSLTFSTFLGGVGSDSPSGGLAVDGSANIYVAGITHSTNFPTANALQPILGPENPPGTRYDAFVTKIGTGAGPGAAPPADFDGNGTTDISVFRPSDGAWYVRNGTVAQFGTSGDVPVPGDYDGNGTTDIAVFRPSTGIWYVLGGPAVAFGTSGDIPVPGDYDGNGTTDIAVFRPSTGIWYIQGGPAVAFGTSGDVPVPGDYDGNGTTDIAVFRPSTGIWYIQGGPAVAFGTSGDIPVPGDFDGNGTTDIAVFRPSTGIWYVQGGPAVAFGTSGDVPVPGDFDGNGTTDIAVFRPSTGIWYVRNGTVAQFGTLGDIALPLPSAIRQALFP